VISRLFLLEREGRKVGSWKKVRFVCLSKFSGRSLCWTNVCRERSAEDGLTPRGLYPLLDMLWTGQDAPSDSSTGSR
jgi:hypothetical protein